MNDINQIRINNLQNRHYSSCEIDNLPLAMAYVPWQKFRNLFPNEFESLKHGTIFKELYLPWTGRSCRG